MYIPNLIGLRALAVAVVFLSHAGFDYVVPGGLGVEIFFVLSGYLITSLALQEFAKTKSFSLSDFFVRRFFRIIPPLLLVVVLALWLNYLISWDSDVSLSGILSQLFFFTNYYWLYIGEEGLIDGSGVFWSLAVEEHFYIVFPFWFLFSISKGVQYFRKSMLVVVFLLAVYRLVAYISGVFQLDHYYFSTDMRVIYIAFGCWLSSAFGWHKNPRSTDGNEMLKEYILLALFIALFITLYLVRSDEFRRVWRIFPQLVCFFMFFRFLLLMPNEKILLAFEFKPIVFLGKISYVFYLSHAIILNILEHFGFKLGSIELLVVGFLLTVVFSSFSYRFFEIPMLSFRNRFLK